MPNAPADSEVIRQAFLAHNRDDLDGFLAALHDDVAWESVGVFLHPAKVWHGREAVREGLLGFRALHGGRATVTLRELKGEAGTVLVVGVVSVPSARRPIAMPVAWVFEMEDGRARIVRGYRNERGARPDWERTVARHRSDAA